MVKTSIIVVLSLIIGIPIIYLLVKKSSAKQKKKLLENYDASKDKSKRGEEFRKQLVSTGNAGARTESREIGTNTGADNVSSPGEPKSEGLAQPEGRELLPPTAPKSETDGTETDGETDNSTGKTSKGFRGFFNLIKRRRK